MKKSYFLFVTILIVVGIYSCKKESKSPAPKDLIVGTWLGILRVDTSYLDGQVNVSLSNYDKNQSVFNYIFNADGTGTSGNDPNSKTSFHYNITNSTINFFNVLSNKYGLEGNISRTVTRLTTSELVIRIDTTYNYTVGFNGKAAHERIVSDFHYVHP